MDTEKKEQPAQKEGILQRLAQASAEGVAMEVAMNTILPGSGIALNSLNQVKNVKKVGIAMGKGAAKEGLEILDGENNEDKSPIENFQEEAILEFLGEAKRLKR